MANSPIGSTELHSTGFATSSAVSSPVTITGANTVGSVLTAVFSSGWSATGFQWTRSGVDISGATSSTYTLAYADSALVVACRVSGLSNSSTGMTIAVATYIPPVSVVIEGDSPVINYILGPTSLTGVTNSSKGSVSFWMQPLYDNTVDNVILRPAGDKIRIQTGVDKRLVVEVVSSGGTLKFWTSPILPATAESHYAISWDVNYAAGLKQCQIYRNGVVDKGVVYDGDAAGVVTLSGRPSIGATDTGNFIGIQTIREVLYWPGVQIDWAANISKVYNAGAAVDVGANGSLVTGSVPAVYLSVRATDTASAFLVNRGTGGDFTTRVGQPTVRADMPILGYGDSLMYGTSSSAYPSKTWMWLTCKGLNTPRRDINYGAGGQGTSWILNTALIPSLAGNFTKYGNNPIWILQGGYNDLAGTSAAIIANLQGMVTNLLATDPAAKYIVLGITNSGVAAQQPGGASYTKIQDVTTYCAANFGAHFLDLRAQLIANGLALAGLSATAFDTADIALETVPSSLRDGTPPNGSVHWNDFGEIAVAALVKAKIQALGYD